MSRVLIPFLKLASFLVQTLRLGSGSTWPGHLALKVDPKFVEHTISRSKTQIVLVVGTNGKTTVSALIQHILESKARRVFRSVEGANLLSGVASTLIKNCTVTGSLPYDFAILEVDENNLSRVLSHVNPTQIVVLNLFRDQLDRYGEVNTIATKWRECLSAHKKKTTLVLNTDDPLVRYLGYKTHHYTSYFALPSQYYEKAALSHDVDSIFCPVCGGELVFSKVAYSHLGKYSCLKCQYTNAKHENVLMKSYPLEGVYNIYNVNAALLSSSMLLDLPVSELYEKVLSFEPAFGRGESIAFEGREFVILLSKNPAGFNQSIERVIADSKAGSVMLVLNDRIPDGLDVSWIWDVNTEELIKRDLKLMVSGDRADDMAIRIQCSNTSKDLANFSVEYSLSDAIADLLRKTHKGDKIYILPTYSAMLEVRKILTGTKFL